MISESSRKALFSDILLPTDSGSISCGFGQPGCDFCLLHESSLQDGPDPTAGSSASNNVLFFRYSLYLQIQSIWWWWRWWWTWESILQPRIVLQNWFCMHWMITLNTRWFHEKCLLDPSSPTAHSLVELGDMGSLVMLLWTSPNSHQKFLNLHCPWCLSKSFCLHRLYYKLLHHIQQQISPTKQNPQNKHWGMELFSTSNLHRILELRKKKFSPSKQNSNSNQTKET